MRTTALLATPGLTIALGDFGRKAAAVMGGAVVGSGVAAMHYTGMLALEERQAHHMRLFYPRRIELGAEGYDEQHRKNFNSVNRATKQFKARGVDPMDILEDHQHCIAARQRLQLRSKRF
jgi:hypothetical protein